MLSLSPPASRAHFSIPSLPALPSVSFMVAFLVAVQVGVKAYLTAALLGISLATSDAEHLPVCLVAIYVFAEKMLIQILCPFFKLGYGGGIVKSSSHVLDPRLLPDL